MRKITCLLLTLLFTSICSAATINVPGSYSTIQAGIDAASEGDTVLVAIGVYVGDGNRDININSKDIVVMSESGPEYTILDLQGSPSSPHRGIRIYNNNSELIGFTIKNGYTTSSYQGGALTFSQSQPDIINCIFINNEGGQEGGAVASYNSAFVLISNCTFVGNAADYGSGIYNDNSHISLINCIVAFGSRGSATYCDNGGNVLPICCDIYGNAGGDWVDCVEGELVLYDNISEDPLFCDTSAADYHIIPSSPCSPDFNTECGLIGALDTICAGLLTLPIANPITFSPLQYGNIVTSLNPEIIWTYVDIGSTTQSAYEIEVGTDNDWSLAEMWDTEPVFSSDTNIIYTGLPLQNFTQYFVRIKVQNGAAWGSWIEADFWINTSSTISIPADQPTIQAGIDIALNGDTVLVANGTYSGDGNRDISFNGKSIVVLSENGPEVTVIDCQGSEEEPHRGFRFSNLEDTTSVISGFTIQNGYGHIEGNVALGGGVYCPNSSPLIVNCIFENNYSGSNGSYAGKGGAVAGFGSSLILRDCIFDNNTARYGGAVYLDGSVADKSIDNLNFRGISNPYIESCIFKSNSTRISTSSGHGGAIYITYDDISLNIEKCVFYNNNSTIGGGIQCGGDANVYITNCTFAFNLSGNITSSYTSVLEINNTIFAFAQTGTGLNISNTDLLEINCCDIYGNEGGDWIGSISGYLGTDGNISADPFFCDSSQSDFQIQGYSPCSPFMNSECQLIGALDLGCNSVIEFPIAAYINYGPASFGHTVYPTDPDIFWSYIDTLATSQIQYEIEIGTDDDWSVAEMWSSGAVSSSDTSVVYAGSPLSRDETYFVRVRVNNGTIWGSWIEDWFYVNPYFIVRVPGLASTIQEGIDLTTSGDTVLVAPGTYTGTGNRDIDYGGRNIVVVSEEGPEVTIIDCEGSQSESHRAFNFVSGEDSLAVLSGFTITGGYGPDQDGSYVGGAIYLYGSSPTINDCKFDQNNAESGGAVYGANASATFSDCQFIMNTATNKGGAVACDNDASTFNNCEFTGNTGSNNGGAIAGNNMTTSFDNCVIENNSAIAGGAMYLNGFDGKRMSNVNLYSCLIYENTAQDYGGALYLEYNTVAQLHNCTLSDNQASINSGILVTLSCVLGLENCIIAYGIQGNGVLCQGPDQAEITCSNIYGNEGGDWTGHIGYLEEQYGNLSEIPQFCDRANDDYSLTYPNSICLPENNTCGVLIGTLGGGCYGYYCGDANNDGAVNISDAVWIIGYVFVGGSAPYPYLSGDVNCDSAVNISDAVWIINLVFVGGNDPCDTNGDGIPDC